MMCYHCRNVRNAMILIHKIDLDLSYMRNYEQRGCYSKLLQYLYLLTCMSPDVTDILSRMQNVYLKSVQLFGEIVTCVTYFMGTLICIPFYLRGILCFVVIYVWLYWSYIFGCRDYHKRNLIGYKSPRYFRIFFLEVVFDAYSWCL